MRGLARRIFGRGGASRDEVSIASRVKRENLRRFARRDGRLVGHVTLGPDPVKRYPPPPLRGVRDDATTRPFITGHVRIEQDDRPRPRP